MVESSRVAVEEVDGAGLIAETRFLGGATIGDDDDGSDVATAARCVLKVASRPVAFEDAGRLGEATVPPFGDDAGEDGVPEGLGATAAAGGMESSRARDECVKFVDDVGYILHKKRDLFQKREREKRAQVLPRRYGLFRFLSVCDHERRKKINEKGRGRRHERQM